MTIMGQVMVLTRCDSQLLICSKHQHSLKEKGNLHHLLPSGSSQENLVPPWHWGVSSEGDQSQLPSPWTGSSSSWSHRAHLSQCSCSAGYLEDTQFCHAVCRGKCNILSGRVPGYKRDDIPILPSSTTKTAVWTMYHDTCSTISDQAVAYSTFVRYGSNSSNMSSWPVQ